MSEQQTTEVLVPIDCSNATKPYTEYVVSAYLVTAIILVITIIYPITRTRAVKKTLRKEFARAKLEAGDS